MFPDSAGNSLGVAKRIQRSVAAKGYSCAVQCMNQWHHVRAVQWACVWTVFLKSLLKKKKNHETLLVKDLERKLMGLSFPNTEYQLKELNY